jgi:hypothetical protein
VTPLALISRYIDDRMLAEIAREYGNGRLLLIGTTDLDAQRPVIWNLGAIAAFPPVLIDVEADGKSYQEMHVDGGAIAQTFLYPPALTAGVDLRKGPLARERRAYVIRNSRLDPEWAAVDRRVFSIAGRAISTMIHFSGQNDAYRLQTLAARDGIDFHLAYIGRDFAVEHRTDFDPPYMSALFEYGRQQMLAGTAWHEGSPIFGPPQAAH